MRVILVPVADRPECARALQTAFDLGERLGASVTGCHMRPHRLSDVTVSRAFAEAAWRRKSAGRAPRAARTLYEQIAAQHGFRVKVAEIPPGPPVLSTLVAEIYGPTLDGRLEVASAVKEVFDSTDGVVDVDWWVEDAQEKLVFRVDREKAALHGVPAASVVPAARRGRISCWKHVSASV